MVTRHPLVRLARTTAMWLAVVVLSILFLRPGVLAKTTVSYFQFLFYLARGDR